MYHDGCNDDQNARADEFIEPICGEDDNVLVAVAILIGGAAAVFLVAYALRVYK